MELFSMFIVGIFLSLNAKPTKANYPKSDELTLRNQLLADVYFLKEGVDKLLISSEIFNKRFSNQMDILKTFQDIIKKDNFDSNELNVNCDKITGLFNATLKKQNILENRLILKLEEIQEDQLTRFEEMLIKIRLNKGCGAQTSSPNSLTLLSTSLAEVSEKMQQFGEKLTTFELLEAKLKAQEAKFDKFAENQVKILQQINENLAKNQEQFDKINQDLTNLKDVSIHITKSITHPRPKLPMEVILGLTSANLTSFK